MSNTTGGWRPDEQLGQLPPEYEPVHHEPRQRPDPRRTRPWQPQQPVQPQQPPQAQQPPQPQARPQWQQQPRQQWQPGPPPRARYDEDSRGQPPGYSGQHGDNGYGDARPGDGGSGYDGGSGFMPGFAAGGQDEYDAQDNEWVAPGADLDQDYDQGQRPPHGRRRRGVVRRLAPWVALLIILIPLGVAGNYVYSLYQNKYHPADFTGAGITTTVVVQVKQGDTATGLGTELASDGVVASSRAFVLAAEHSTSTTGLVPGFFRLHEHMQASVAYSQLINPANLVQLTARIPEGLRKSQILARLAAVTGPHISQAAYQQALTSPALGLPSYANGNAEGYLFPATYQLPPNATALTVLQQMVQRFNAEAAAVNLTSAAAKAHLTPAKVIVVASLLQAEGGKLSDYPKIARVIYNRLALGMPLQFDSTVLYGLNTYGIRATDAQLKSTSPYNTYKYRGLPPGPIDSPGDAAIQAALHPAAGNWVYFVTTDPATGYTQFTNSVTQFEQFQQELNQNTKG